VRIHNLLVHGKLYEQIPVHERMLPIVEGVLDPGCLVSSLSSISIDPSQRAGAHTEDVQNLLVLERTERLGAATRGRGVRRPRPGGFLETRESMVGGRPETRC